MTLDELIQQGEALGRQIHKSSSHHYTIYLIQDKSGYESWKAQCSRFLHVQFPKDKFISDFEVLCAKHINPTYHNQMLAILKAFKDIPLTINLEDAKKDNGFNINVNQTQSQQQTQEQAQETIYNIFIESIKDELTGKQMKEITSIVQAGDNPETTKAKITDKLLSFGGNVLSNILANIITNPLLSGAM